MIKIKLDVSKVPKDRIFIGKKGKYLDLVLIEKPDNYGNDGFVKIDVSKEAREAGDNGEIVGSWKELGSKPKQQQRPVRLPSPPPQRSQDPDLDQPDDDIPFDAEALHLLKNGKEQTRKLLHE